MNPNQTEQYIKWPKNHNGKPLPGFYPRANITPENEGFSINLSTNVLTFEAGEWNDDKNPKVVPEKINPAVTENIILKRRVDALTRTTAISELELQQIKDEISEAEEILHQLERYI